MGDRDIHLSLRAVEWLTKSPYNYGYQFATDIAHRACDGKRHTVMNPINQHVLWCGVEDVRAMFNKTPYKVDYKTKQEHAVITPNCMDCIIKLEIALEAVIMKPYKHLKEYLRVREIEVTGYKSGHNKAIDVVVKGENKVWRGPHSGTYFAKVSLIKVPPDDDPDWVSFFTNREGKVVAKTQRQMDAEAYLHKQEETWFNETPPRRRYRFDAFYFDDDTI